ncbi:MAG TPA: helix-turn-helix transcriptional regulator [Candidatus Baltobacteraceae bacterium]
MIDQDAAAWIPDSARRHELRSFLLAARARLLPGDLGLPRTARRRVPGLRRDEVAELAGVSVDWYRWFESGRQVRVSPQLIARLACVLRLSADEELTIYRLAFPEIYQAHVRATAAQSYLPRAC